MIIKYLIVGLANTLITAIIIFILMAIGVNLYISNAFGYIIGILSSYILNSFFTFKVKTNHTRLIKFLLICFICYLTNLLAIKTILILFKEAQYIEYIAQLTGMFFYTISGYFLNKLWVMK